MPELPEVETMVRGLRPAMAGRVVRRVEVRDPLLLQGCSAREMEDRVTGARVVDVSRRGKWVVLALGDAGLIVIQPRMTGGFWLVSPAREDHVRLVFAIDGSPGTVWYCDARRLGKIAWYPGAEDAERDLAWSHGPDALAITRDDLAARLARTTRGIKPALMDQKVLAGIGNIYADEVLFRARVHPSRPASGLSAGEVERVHLAIGSVLAEAIAAEGSSFDAGYRTVLGLEGGFLARNAVHRRKGQPCPSCGGGIVKTKIDGLIGRPTYFCPSCQPERPPSPSGRGRGPSGRLGGDRVS